MGEEEAPLDVGLEGYSDSGSDFHETPSPALPSGLRKVLVAPGPGISRRRPKHGDEVSVFCTAAEPAPDAAAIGVREDARTPNALRFTLGKGEVCRFLDIGVETMRLGERARFIFAAKLVVGGPLPPDVSPSWEGNIVLEVELVNWISVTDLRGDGIVVKRTWRRPEDRRWPVMGQECLLDCRVVEEDSSNDAVPLLQAKGLEYRIGGPAPQWPSLAAPCKDLLDEALLSMRRGELASFHCSAIVAFGDSMDLLPCEFQSEAPVRMELEVKEFLEEMDISFEKDGLVRKRSLRSRDSWPPCQEMGRCTLHVISVKTGSGILSGDQILRFVVGVGEVCDALECAVLAMRINEVAIVTCFSADMCDEPLLGLHGQAGTTFHLEVTHYEAGPQELLTQRTASRRQRDEDVLDFLDTLKANSVRLLDAGRLRLAAYCFSRCVELVGFVDDLQGIRGGETRWARVTDLKKKCSLNRALCVLKLGKYRAAVQACDVVLDLDPRNVKAAFRRAQAFLAMDDCESAVRDARAAAEIEPRSAEIRQLLSDARAKVRERHLCSKPTYAKMCDGLGRLPHPLDVD